MSADGADVAHAKRSLRLLLEAYAGCELPQWDLFINHARTIRVEQGEVLFSAGELHPYLYYIQQGLVRAQIHDAAGRLTTAFFSEEGDILASMPALGVESVRRVAARGLYPRPEALRAAVGAETVHTVTTLEPCLLVRVSYRLIEHLSAQHLAWMRLVTAVALLHATSLQMGMGWLRSTPEQRYRSLLRAHPSLVERVTQRDLAGFLNITDAALSRIAKRVRAETPEL